jgi:steroid 5-alpha reductase family enzyme
MIRESRPKMWFLANLVGINLMPTVIVFLQLAGAYRFIEAAPDWNGWIVGGAVVSLTAVFLQSLADHQMETFRKRNQEGKKRCIEEGLWKISRHPNYFGEVALWWGVWMISSAGVGIFDWFFLAPILMTCLFLFISIPMMEKRILGTRPEYRNYQHRVSMLVPFFRRPTNEPMEEEEKTRF